MLALKILDISKMLLFLMLALLWCGNSYADCTLQSSISNNVWSYAQNYKIGPSSLTILPLRFQPAGTILFDQTYPMTTLLQASSDTILVKCTTEDYATVSGAALRLDDTYSTATNYQSFTVNGETYYFTAYTDANGTGNTVGFQLYGVMADGTERLLVKNDATSATNTSVKYTPLIYRSCSDVVAITGASSSSVGCTTYPYVITASDFPSVRLVLVRAPYDNSTSSSSDKFIGRIGYLYGTSGISTSSTYGYITLTSEYKISAGAACGITQVPATVDLGSQPVSSLVSGGASWSSFIVTYECTTTNSPVSSLRIGIEPQNRANLLSRDYHYLLPDNADTSGPAGVGIVYRRDTEVNNRYWIQNSGCTGISTDTVNNSNCTAASSQTEAQGWYTVSPDFSGTSSTSGYTAYTENFAARLEALPGATSDTITTGNVSATVNVLVNQP